MATPPASSPTADTTPAVSITTFMAHRRIVISLFFATLFVIYVLSYDLKADMPRHPVLESIALAGALGGFVSALRRNYTFNGSVPAQPAVRVFGKSHVYALVYALIPPLMGAIAGVVLYDIFAAQLVTVGVFPAFSSPTGRSATHPSLATFLTDWLPSTPTDLAKVLLWAFVAGFSERFVPDLLTKLTAAADR